MGNMYETEARDDFNRARKNAFFSEIVRLFSRDREDLLSLHEVRDVLKPRSERYRGMQEIPIEKIVGSEGRYRDFTKQFLPKHEHLRNRWQSVDLAHLTDVILPPITLYEIGGVYFVRDGNHRVSVARAQGVKMIDAEVVALDTEIPLHGTPTRENLRRAVIDHEREQFLSRVPLDRMVPELDLRVTATGRYDEIEQHIYGHKYYLNEHEVVEIPVEHAARSWYENVYRPIVEVLRENRLMTRFRGRTETDLYLWIVKHWDELKHRYGDDFSVQQAAEDYTQRYGENLLKRLARSLRRLFRRD